MNPLMTSQNWHYTHFYSPNGHCTFLALNASYHAEQNEFSETFELHLVRPENSLENPLQAISSEGPPTSFTSLAPALQAINRQYANWTLVINGEKPPTVSPDESDEGGCSSCQAH